MNEDVITRGALPLPVVGRGRRGSARRVLCFTSAVAFVSLRYRAAVGAWWWIASLGPVPRGESWRIRHVVLDREGGCSALHHAGWTLALAGDAQEVDPRFLVCCSPTRTSASRAIPASIRWHFGARPRNSSRNGRIVSGGSTITMQVARLLEPRSERTLRREASPDGARGRSRARARARTRSSRSISASRPMAAISKACARPRSPISARSRAGCRSAERRCWWRCRSRRKRAVRTALSPLRATRATACSTGWRRPASSRLTRSARQARAACRRGAGRCRCWRRMPPMSALPPAPEPQHPPAHHRRDFAKETSKTLRANAPVRSARKSRSRSLRSITRPAKCTPVSPRRTISMSSRAGQVDMTQALRSPGSALKPFIYGLGFEDGLDPSRNPDRRPTDPLRQLCAGEFRLELPGHGHGTQGLAAFLQRAGGGGARSRRREPPHRAA